MAGGKSCQVSPGCGGMGVIRLYQYEISPFCDKVRRALNWKGVDFEVQNVSIARTLRGDLKKLGPAAKVPVLEVEGECICDSTDIIEYIEKRWPDPPLFPKDGKQRALVHILEDWADESLYFYELTLRFTLPHNQKRWVPAVLNEDGKMMRGIGSKLLPMALKRTAVAQGIGRKSLNSINNDLNRHFRALNDLLSGDWLVGTHITLADIAVCAQIYCISQTP